MTMTAFRRTKTNGYKMLIFIDSNCLIENNTISNNNRLETENPHHSMLIMLIAHVSLRTTFVFVFPIFCGILWSEKEITKENNVVRTKLALFFLLKLKASFVWHIRDFRLLLLSSSCSTFYKKTAFVIRPLR